MVRKIPPPKGPRVETGTVQIGDDWPGLFIRGDDCAGHALYLRMILEGEASDEIGIAVVAGLLDLLEKTRQ